MSVLVAVKGKQLWVNAGDVIVVDRVTEKEGDKVDLPIVLSEDKNKVSLASKQKVVAVVVSHGQGKKVRIFKHHAKKRYRRTQGHRQQLSTLKIETIETK